MNTEQAAADLQTKITNLHHELAGRLQLSIPIYCLIFNISIFMHKAISLLLTSTIYNTISTAYG